MNDYNRVSLLIILALLIFTFSGCQGTSKIELTPSPIVISKATGALTSLPLATPSPSATNTAKASITPTLTMTITDTPTQPPISTLLPTEAAIQVQDLMKTNGGCHLPCWWRIEPGKTSWTNAYQTLAPISSEEVYIYNKNGDKSFSAGFEIFIKNHKT